MPLLLSLRSVSPIPIELEGILPESLASRSLSEIERLPVLLGNRELPLAELFRVSGSPDDEALELSGDDLSSLHRVGARMTRGTIRAAGDVGRHLGAEMAGGTIEIDGGASDWVGAEMRGGRIHLRGSAGHLVGGAYRGATRGMSGGTILVDGDAGNEVGRHMRRGLIAVRAAVGDAVGYGLLAGTIVVGGSLGIRSGANMRRGTIICLSDRKPVLLSTFRPACRLRPAFWRLLAAQLQNSGFELGDADRELEFALFHGDFLAGVRGELLLAASSR